MNVPLLTFIGGTAAVAGMASLIYDLVLRYRRQVSDRLIAEFQPRPAEGSTTLFKDLSRLARELDPEKPTLRDRWDAWLEQADVSLAIGQVLGLCSAAGLVVSAIVQLWLANPWLALALFPIGAVIPLVAILLRRRRRIENLCQQLPDAFEMMSRAIRAGQTVTSAFHVAAENLDAPLADEFAWCYEQQNLGLPQEVALRDLARRTAVPELQMLVVVLLVQRQAGGSPVELLNSLSSVVRKRLRLKGKVKALTAEGRMQALVLLLLPPMLLAVVSLLNARYAAALWERPMFLWIMAASELVGALWIRRIIQFDY